MFNLRNLSVLAYANGFTLWHYKMAAGKLDESVCPGFFDPAAELVASGDMMLVSAPEGGRVLCLAGHGTGLVAAPMA